MTGQKERLTKELEQLEKTYKAGIINEREFTKGKERIQQKLDELESAEAKEAEGKKIMTEILDEDVFKEAEKEEPKKIKEEKPKPKKPAPKPKKKAEKKKPAKPKEDYEDEDEDSTFSRVIIFAGIIAILLLLVLVKVFTTEPITEAPERNLSMINTTVNIDTYFEFSCVYAQEHWQNMLILKQIYGDAITIRVKHFPQSMESLEVENAVRCARDQNKHVAYINRIFENEDQLTVDDLKKYAWVEGLDVIDFNECVDDLEHLDRIREDLQAGLDLGVRETPVTFVDGTTINGAQSIEVFEAVIDEKLGIK